MNVSDLARPPITARECEHAAHAICRFHDGRIATDPTPEDIEGRVYFCPIGRMAWRYTTQSPHPLKLPRIPFKWKP